VAQRIHAPGCAGQHQIAKALGRRRRQGRQVARAVLPAASCIVNLHLQPLLGALRRALDALGVEAGELAYRQRHLPQLLVEQRVDLGACRQVAECRRQSAGERQQRQQGGQQPAPDGQGWPQRWPLPGWIHRRCPILAAHSPIA